MASSPRERSEGKKNAATSKLQYITIFVPGFRCTLIILKIQLISVETEKCVACVNVGLN